LRKRGRKRYCKARTAVRAHPDADHRDVELHRRQEARRVLEEAQGRPCPAASAFCELAQPRRARRKKRELGHREQAIHENEGGEDQEVGQHGAPGMPAAAILAVGNKGEGIKGDAHL
jgi:hypothetical protein